MRRVGTVARRPLVTRQVIVSLLLLSLIGFQFVNPSAVKAAPVLSVSTAVSKPLLGGTATVTVTITNTGDEKGYNLSLTELLASDLVNPNGRVTIVDSSVAPTSVSLDAGTGDTTIDFYDIVDLAPTESFTITYEVSIAGDPSWEVGRLLTAATSARVNTVPDNSGSWINGADTAQADVIPIDLVYKRANQSTSVQQDLGTTTRPYSYTLLVQNNYVNPSASVVVTDTLPDGIEYLGVTSGPAPDAGYPQRDPATGETELRWTLGTMAPGANVSITYAAGIRYDYYGTDNGGTNRTHDDFSSAPATAAIVAHKTGFANTAGLASEYRGSLPATITPTDSDSAAVEGTYITIDKSGTPGTGGHGTVVDYTLTYATSEYYTADAIIVTDTLPDGMTYVAGSASPVPSSVTPNADGTTLIVWDAVPALGTTGGGSITFQAVVDTTWEQPGYAGEPIRAGDSMTNTAELASNWHDQVKPPRNGNDVLVAEVSAGLSTGLPAIDKAAWDPDLGAWTDSIEAQVGDEILYRVRFNTADGLTPLRTDISLGYITLTDWLPPGTVYNGDAVPSYDATFTLPPGAPPSATLNPVVPRAVTIGSLNGLEWFLGDMSADGWWETTFTVTVQDVPVVQEGLKTGNHWKLTGVNTFGQEYSDRDIVSLDYHAPLLTLDKVASSVPNPLVAGSTVGYTITIDNIGLGDAEDLVITDYLPVGTRTTTPTVSAITLDGAPLAPGAWTTSYVPATGRFDIDLTPTLPGTGVPAGSRMVVLLSSTVDSTTGAGTTLTDIATVAYNTQPDGSGRPVAGTVVVADPNTDDAAVTLTRATITKTGPAGPIRIGDTVTYTINVTVPAGAIAYWPRLIDRSDRDGIWYVPGTAALSTLGGTPPVPAAFDTTSTPVRTQTGTANRTDFTWNLANPIDNRGQASAYQFRLTFDAQYTGVRDDGTQELYPPTATDTLPNRYGRIEWNTTNPATRPGTPNANAQSGSVTTQVDQPVVALDKTEASVGPYAGNSTVTYQVVLTNANFGATAYDLDWDDTLPAYLGSPALVSVTHSALGDISGSVTADFTSAPNVSIDFGGVSLAQGQSITIRYTAVVDANVPAATSLTNASDVDWSSLPGTPAGSRRYSDAVWETYTGDSDAVTIAVAQPSIDKTVVGPDPASIGETVTYRMRVTVPAETVLPSAYVLDTIAADGFTYVPGSAAVSAVSGSPEVAASVASATFDDAPAPGSTLRVDFTADIDNSSGAAGTGDVPYVFDVVAEFVYDGLTDAGGWTFFPAGASDAVSDTGALYWSIAGVPRSVTDAASTAIDQPRLTLVKTEQPVSGPYEGGETVGYRAVITNTGWATAYNLSWDDLLSPQMSDPGITAVTHSALADILASVTPDTSSDDAVSIDFGAVTLAPGQTITVDWTAVVDPGTGAGSLLTDTADVDWESHPTSPSRRVYDDGPDEASWTADTDQATVQVDFAVIDKSVESGITTRTIGETFDYTVSFSIPTSTTAYNVAITDMVPDGLTVLGVTPSAPIGSVLVGPELMGMTTIVWNVGDVSNPPVATLALDITVRVDEAFFGGSALDGLPAPIDGDGVSTVLNTATIVWDDADTGGTTRTSSDSVTVTAVEPHLTIDKSGDDTDLAAGDTVRYTARVVNDGTAPAYDTAWSDTVPAALFAAGTSPSFVSATIDGTPLVPGADFTASFGAAAVSTLDLAVPLAPGSTLDIVYDATLVGGVARGTALTNTARVDTYTSMPGPVPGERAYGPISDTWTVTALAPRLTLDKQTLGDTEIQRGDSVTFSLAISNTGDAAAYSVNVTDTLPAGLTYVPGSVSGTLPGIGAFADDPAVSGQELVWDFGGALDLAPGDTATFTFEASADSDAPLGTLTNSAEAGATDGAGTPVPPAGGTSGVLVTDPRAAVLKRLADGQDPFVQVGDTVSFVIAVTNTGSTVLETVRVIDVFDPAYLAYRPAATSPAADSAVGDTLVWTDVTGAGSLAVGETTTITVGFDVIAKPPASLTTDVASVTSAIDEYGDSAPPVSSPADAGITGPATSVDKRLASGQPAVVSVGEAVTFDIAVTNSGDTTLTTLALADTFDPAVFAFESATPDVSASGVGVLGWADITTHFGDIDPGDTVTVALTMRSIGPGVGSTDVASVVAAIDLNGDPAGLGSDPASATVVAPDITVAKSADATSAGPGDTIAYTIDIANVGDGPAHELVLTDAVPAALWPPTVTGVLLDGVTPLVAGTDYTLDLSSPNDAVFTFASALDAGHTIEIAYEVTLAGGTPAGLSLVNTASAVYTSLPGTDPYEVSYGPETASETLVTRAPALAIDKAVVGDTEVQHGQEVTYRVTVSNTGDAPAEAVRVTDTLPAGLDYVAGSTSATWSGGGVSSADPTTGDTPVWDFGGTAWIAPGEDLVLEFRAVVSVFSTTGVKTNSAQADATDGGGSPLAPVTHDADVLVTRPLAAVDKHLADGQDPFVQVGDVVRFEIVVTNVGTTGIVTLPLTDTFDAAYLDYRPADTSPPADSVASGLLGWDDLTGGGALLPGESTTVTVGFDVIAHPATSSTTDTATIAGAIDEYDDPVPDRSESEPVGITEPRVALEKRLSDGQPGVVALGDVVSFDIVVRNSGDTTLTTVPLSDVFDAGLEFVSATPAPSSVTTPTIVWDDITDAFGDLAPGESATVTVRFVARSAGADLLNTASIADASTTDINGDTTPGTDDDVTVDVYDPADVTFTKTADPADGTIVLPGQTITYSLAFANSTEVTLTDVVLRDELPETVAYDTGSMVLESAGTTATLTDEADGDAGTFDPAAGPQGTVIASLGDVPAGTAPTLTFRVVVGPEQVSRRGVVNSARATMNDRPIADAGPVNHPVDPFDIVKTGRDVNGGKLAPGDQIEWTILVTNTGLTPTTNVVVRDTVPAETSFVAGSMTGLGADERGAPELVWNVGVMDVGESVTLTFRSTVKSGTPAGTRIENQAVVTADQSEAKVSDYPETTELGDPTLLRTGGNDWVWLIGALAALGGGVVLLRRRDRDEPGARPRPRPRRRRPVARHA